MKPSLWSKEFVLVTLVNFFTAVNFYLLMIIVAEFAMKRFDAVPAQAGLAASIFVIGTLAARMFVGAWMTRFGCKRVLLIGVVGGFVMTLLYFASKNIAILLLVRFFHGVAFGVTTTALATIVAVIVPRERSGEGIGYYSLSQILATAVGPFIGIFLSQHGDYNTIFGFCSLVSAACILFAPAVTLRKSEFPEKQKAEKTRFRIGNFIEPTVVPISFVNMLFFLCYSSIVSFLAVYTKQINLVATGGFFFLVYSVAVIASRPMAGRLFDRKGENVVMYPACLCFALGIFLFSQSHYGTVLLLSSVLIGLGFGTIESSTQTIAVKIAPRERMALANSTYFLGNDIGMGLGPLLAGFVIPFLNYRRMYLLVAVIALFCIFLYFLAHGAKAGRSIHP